MLESPPIIQHLYGDADATKKNVHNDNKNNLNVDKSVEDRQILFQNFANQYTNQFRTGIDYQFAEEPRQIIGMGILAFGIGLFGWYWDGKLESDWTDSQATQSALLAVLFCLLVYCFLQTRDGLLVRPHPGVWRIFHAFGLFHLFTFVILAALPATVGRRFIRLALPGLKPLDHNVFEGTVDLQCQLSFKTLKIQFTKMWFIAHILGWFAKMCIFRNWIFCLVLSVAFESMELSFQWLIPELRECWWDSLFVDVLLSNMIGMICGYLLLIVCGSLPYDWLNRPQSVDSTNAKQINNDASPNFTNFSFTFKTLIRQTKRFILRFIPFTWCEYHWDFFRTPERLCQATFLLVFALLSELNVFLMMYALDIPAPHLYHKLRVTYLCFLAISGVAETYNYINQSDYPKLKRRIGHNAWLYVSIILIETIVVFRYGQTRFITFIPDTGVIIPWSLTFILLSGWCFFHFVVVGPERLDIPKGIWSTMIQSEYSTIGNLNEKKNNNHSHKSYQNVNSGIHLDKNQLNSNMLSASTIRYRKHLINEKDSIIWGDMAPQTELHKLTNQEDFQHTTPTASNETCIEDEMTISSHDISQMDSTPDCEVLKRVAEFMSPLRLSRTELSNERYINEDTATNIKEIIRLKRLQWGWLYYIGLYIVSFPPMGCFLPLIALIRFYDYD